MLIDSDTHDDIQKPMDIKRHIDGFPEEYKQMMEGQLSKQQIELLDGRDMKSHEGMIFGQMYADWKEKKNPHWNQINKKKD
tara:strand:- start:4889 stop:5131 length:243 start_codon:yes stop_codon:yes gene_type:complete